MIWTLEMTNQIGTDQKGTHLKTARFFSRNAQNEPGLGRTRVTNTETVVLNITSFQLKINVG